jgi:hypothetical protein
MGKPRIVTLEAIAATRESFAEYGALPPVEGDGNPTADLEFVLADGWVNYIAHTRGEIEVRHDKLRCELLNRHDTHTQTLMPMTGDALVVVAPAEVDFSRPEHFDAVKAFALPRATPVCTCIAAPGTGARIRRGRRGHDVQHPGPRLPERQRNRVAPRSRRGV